MSGFPLDEIWHAEYGVDVTMWSPTHMLMILGASLTGFAAWLVLAEAGVRPSDGRWGRGLHVVAGWFTLQGLVASQGEFTFGVPQFAHVFHPILICLAAGFGLVVARLVLGWGWALGVALLATLLEVLPVLDAGGEGSPAETRFGATFLASAVAVELVAAALGTERLLRFGVAAGVSVGTIGLAGEWLWNQNAYQPWTSALLPDALILGATAATGAAVLGAAVGRAMSPQRQLPPVPVAALVTAGVAVVATIVLPLPRRVGDVQGTLSLDEAGRGTAFVEVVLDPVDAADDARWFQASAWQGGGLVLADMEPTGEPGSFRSDRPVPIDGYWKSLVRLHRGDQLMALPIFLPRDEEIDEPEISAVDRTAAFEGESKFLLRETTPGNGWLTVVVHGYLVAVVGLWVLAFVIAVAGLTRADADRKRSSGVAELASGERAGR